MIFLDYGFHISGFHKDLVKLHYFADTAERGDDKG
jgi:hypothetical protein